MGFFGNLPKLGIDPFGIRKKVYETLDRGLIYVRDWVHDVTAPPSTAQPSQWHENTVFNTPITPLVQPTLPSDPYNSSDGGTTTIIEREVIIYREPIVPDRIKEIPETPPRRLPKVTGDAQTAFKTPIGQAITVQKAAKEREYGRLLFNPLIKRKEKVRQGRNDKIVQDINNSIDKAKERFGNWMTAQMDSNYANSEEYLENKLNFWDASCLIMPEKLRAFDGKVNLLYGIDSLALMAEYYSDLSINALMPVRDNLPTEYEIVDYKPESNKTELTEQKDLEVIGDAQVTSVLAPRAKIWRTPRVIENWLRLEGVQQYKDGEEHRSGLIENLPDLVVSLLSSLYYRSGFHRFPAVLPDSMVDSVTDDKKGSKDKEPKEVVISDSLSLQEWSIKQLDAYMGQFPIELKYKDDKGKEHEVKFPNIAETLAETVSLLLGTSADSEATLAIALKNLAETSRASNNALLAHDYARANAEYMGYKGSLKGKKIKISYNPKAENLNDLLQGTESQIQRWEMEDDDLLVEKINKIVIAAGIIKGALQIPWKPGEELLGSRISQSKEKQKEQEDETWKEFVDRLNNPRGIYKTRGLPTPFVDEIKKGD
ncbi:MAG: hypothetical protein ACRC2R_10845 [Xenococcaceae cyanobacterium]